MNGMDIQSIFGGLLDEPINHLVEKARAADRRVIGYTCSYIPEPLLDLDGMVPVRMRAPGVAGTPRADTYLSNVNCFYTRSLLEFMINDRYASVDGWVFTASCDHLRRLYDNLNYLKKASFNHMIDLPHKLGPAALGWYVQELEKLAAALASCFGIDMSDAKIAGAIERHNAWLDLVRSIGALRQQKNPPITGTEFHTIFLACAVSPKDMIMGPLAGLKDALENREVMQDDRARLLVVGSTLDDTGYLRTIESEGALVVADRFCLGSIPGLEPIPAPVPGSAIETLAEHTLRKTSCPRMMEELDSRIEDILDAAEKFSVDGIIVETMKYCDIWGVEAIPLISALRETGIPVLKLEREYAPGNEGQLRTRVQAFVESMET